MVQSRQLTFHAERPFLLLDEVSAVTPAPTNATLVKVLNHGTDLRTLISYSGALTSVTLQLWLHAAGSKNGTIWYRGEAVTLVPADGPLSIDWPLGDPTRFDLQVSAIAGTGAVTVLAYNIELGSGARRA